MGILTKLEPQTAELAIKMRIKPIAELVAKNNVSLHENPLLSRVLQNRGIESVGELTYEIKDMLDPFLMKGMQAAVDTLEEHIRANSKILVIGDFDCDGATSTSIAVEGLRLLGATNVHYLIPDRKAHGYGLSVPIVKLAEECEPDLIVTVDNGIASLDGARAVAEIPGGCDLLITDHHLPVDGGEIPVARAIINPNQAGCEYPSKNLAGCGVIFSAIVALRSSLRAKGYYSSLGIKEPNIAQLIDLVALGTIADVVPLDYNNRLLVHAGLRRIRAGHGRPGIRALLEVAKKDPAKVVASDFGFALGPRINAAGRLEGMSQGIECLLSADYDQAVIMATRLDELNMKRRNIEADHVADAAAAIEKLDLDDLFGVVVHDKTHHAGVVGIVASRIKDKINRPVICMTDSGESEAQRDEVDRLILAGAPQSEIEAAEEVLSNCYAKGSARSIPGVHLKHVLDKIASKYPDILHNSKYGGHAMAAGVGVKNKNLPLFSRLFNEEVKASVTAEMLSGVEEVDLKDISSEHINLVTAQQIIDLGPWGQKFPEPLFHANLIVVSTKVLSEKHLKMTLSVDDGSAKVFDAIAFNCIVDGQLPVVSKFEGTFSIAINDYRGKQTVQLMLRHIFDPDVVSQAEYRAKKIQDEKERELDRQKKVAAAIEQHVAARAQDVPVEAVNTKIQGTKKRKPVTAAKARNREEIRETIKGFSQ